MTALALAQRWIGVAEAPGIASNPDIVRMLRLTEPSVAADDVPWCSAFVNFIAWATRLPRSKSLAARSWLTIGTVIPLAAAQPGFDVVVLKRGKAPQPGPEVVSGAPGHVGFFAGLDGDRVWITGGNQGDAVTTQAFPAAQVLGVRRLA